MRVTTRLVVLVALMSLSACTHSMTIVNRSEYEGQALVLGQRSFRFAVETDVTAEDLKGLVEAVKEGLAANSSVERVAYSVEAPGDFIPDFIVRVRPTTEYEGSGWNYPITFPGFLIFTHAWNGFVYKADVDTQIEILTPGVAQPVATQTVKTHFNLRHCDFERGAWTSSGWYTPFYGGINLIIGFFMIPYDQDATPDFVREANKPYGRFVASRVIEMTAAIPPAATSPDSRIAEPEASNRGTNW